MAGRHAKTEDTGSHDTTIVVESYGNAKGLKKQFAGSDPESLSDVLDKLAAARAFAEDTQNVIDNIRDGLAEGWQGSSADEANEVVRTLRSDAASVSSNAETVRASLALFQSDWRHYRNLAAQLDEDDEAGAHQIFDGFTKAQDDAMKRIPPHLVYHTPFGATPDLGTHLSSVGADGAPAVGPLGLSARGASSGLHTGVFAGAGGVSQIGLSHGTELAGFDGAFGVPQIVNEPSGILIGANTDGPTPIGAEGLGGPGSRRGMLGPMGSGASEEEEEENKRNIWLDDEQDLWKGGGGNGAAHVVS